MIVRWALTSIFVLILSSPAFATLPVRDKVSAQGTEIIAAARQHLSPEGIAVIERIFAIKNGVSVDYVSYVHFLVPALQPDLIQGETKRVSAFLKTINEKKLVQVAVTGGSRSYKGRGTYQVLYTLEESPLNAIPGRFRNVPLDDLASDGASGKRYYLLAKYKRTSAVSPAENERSFRMEIRVIPEDIPSSATEQQKTARKKFRNAEELTGGQKHAESIALYTEAIRLDPAYAEPFCARGFARKFRGEKSVAVLQDLDTCLLMLPKEPLAFALRGLVKAETGDREGALADADTALGLSKSWTSYYNRGLIKLTLKDEEGAFTDFNTAISLQKGAQLPLLRRGALKNRRGDYTGGLQDCTAVIALNLWNREAYMNCGFAAEKLGQYKEAAGFYQQVLSRDEKNVKAKEGYERMQQKLQQ